MRLNRERTKQNYRMISKKQPNHLKTSSMDNISSSSKSKNIYLNKVLQKNFANSNKLLIKDNIQNFQSSIQNIFSNDEKRQKAKNYVINLRSKNNTQSPFQKDEKNLQKNKTKNEFFSGTNYGRFYNDNLRRTYEILNENNNYYRSSQKERPNPINLKNVFDNNDSPEINTGFIKVNKINRVKDEKLIYDNNINSNDIIVNYNDNNIYFDSLSEINTNNSGYNQENKLNYEGFKYNPGKSPNYYNNENENKYMSKSKTNNYFSRNADKSKDSRFNYNSDKKEKINNDKNNFYNLKIEKNRFKLESFAKNNKNIKTSFKNIIPNSINELNIRGNNRLKYIPNPDNQKLISNLQNIIKNQKKEIDSKIKEINKYKINSNRNENKKLIEAQKNYESLLKINNEEKKNYLKEINKLKEAINKYKSEEKVEQKLEEDFNKLKIDYNNIDDEYQKLKEELNIIVKENQSLKEHNKNLNENNNKDLNDALQKQNESLNQDLNKLKEELNKINLEKENYKKEIETKDEQNVKMNEELNK